MEVEVPERAGAPTCLRELDRDVKDLPRDLSKVPDIAAQHQIHMADHAAR